MPRPSPPFLALAALLGPLLGPPRGQAQERVGDSGTSTVAGIVRDHETKAPVPGASITFALRTVSGESSESRTTDENGRYVMREVQPGPYQVTITSFAYRTLVDTVVVDPRSEVRVIFEISATPFEMEPLVVTTDRGVLGFMDGFEERRARDRVHTMFLTREEIQKHNAFYISDYLRMAPETVISPGPGLRLRCGAPDLYVNGVLEPFLAVDDFPPEIIEAVELYTTRHEVPREFPQVEGCGVIALWLRPRDPELVPPLWRRWAVAVGAVALTVLLLR